MRVASWNVNSIRARLEHVVNWWDEAQPDVLCLQETKVADDMFPLQPFKDRGLHVYNFGQPAYNGVAFISKLPLEQVQKGFPDVEHDGFDGQKRFIKGRLNGVTLINVYAPNGDNPLSDKFVYKEQWYNQLRTYFDSCHKTDELVLICGDLNIAPHAIDVADPEAWFGKCGFHPLEHQWLQHVMDWGLVDVFRHQHPDAEGMYSWWDYRMNSFKRNRGMRIDNILVSKPLAEKCVTTLIDATPRTWEKPSDHTPVIATFKL